jgi:hypothetical protein
MIDGVKALAPAGAQGLRDSDHSAAIYPTDSETPQPIQVVDGNAQLGRLERRLWTGHHAIEFEAFDLADKSIGLFTSEREAAEALWRRAHGGTP